MASDNNGEFQNQLNGWKEIAEYLGVDERTAQRWEAESGLPVRRFKGPRGRVTADPQELDQWRRAKEKPRLWSNLRFLRAYAIVLTIAMAGTWVSLGWSFWRGAVTGPPASFRLDTSVLRVFDARGKQIWQYQFAQAPERNQYESGQAQQNVGFADLDGDGRKELLFNYFHERTANGIVELLCFSAEGQVLWRFAPQKQISDAVQSFPPDYVINRFYVLPQASGPGQVKIVVASTHYVSYPSHLAVLDRSGKLLGEYWHSGHLYHVNSADLDHDGREEILLGGTNNGYKQATLVVLDPQNASGASRQYSGDPLQLRDLRTGHEKAVVLFPRTRLNERTEPFNSVMAIWIAQGKINLTIREKRGAESGYLAYALDQNLTVNNVSPSEGLIKLYGQYLALGQVKIDLFRDELPRLRKIAVRRFGEDDFIALR